MKTLRILVLPALLAGAAAGTVGAQQPDADTEENQCLACHGNSDVWDEDTKRLFVTEEMLADDVHWKKGLRCRDCHGGNADTFDLRRAHATDDGFRAIESPADISNLCGHCHSDPAYMKKYRPSARTDQVETLAQSVHGKQPEGADGAKAVTCVSCHGAHGIRAPADPESPVFLDNQVETCGRCHEKHRDEYLVSVHGLGLEKSGLSVTAVCADCHGAHNIFPAKERRSTLHPDKVAATCGACHYFIRETLEKSVHGRGSGPGGATEKAAPGDHGRPKPKRRPSCTDCHQGHDLPDPRSARFRVGLPHRCGNCHVKPSKLYNMSLHGELTELGYGPGAKCSDCHGAHDILPIDDPRSRLFGENRINTCRKCHADAAQNFCSFHPHADHRDRLAYPLEYWTRWAMQALIWSVFGFFGFHTLLWFVRSLIHVFRHGRPKRLAPRRPAYVRFAPIHRTLHAMVIVSFLGLALTGLPLRYSDQSWAQTLAGALGGFRSTSVFHHICAVATFLYFGGHLVWLLQKVFQRWRQGTSPITLVFGPDSPVPNVRDFTDMFAMFRWFFGLGPKPGFERWSYWEKFDYWAVFWGVTIIGASGLALWLPDLFCRFLPGEVLNVAKVIHSEEALLATSFIFAIHFFGTHLRPEKFPMDTSILTGLVTEEELRHERPEMVERLKREGQWEQLRRRAPGLGEFVFDVAAGTVALGIGLALLVAILAAVF